MKLTGLLAAERVVDLKSRDKAGALRELCAAISTSKNITDAKAFSKAILDREAILSTGIGLGLAMPHAKVPSVSDFTVALGRSKAGIEWDSLDGAPVQIVVMIGANDTQAAEYTKVLAAIVTKMKDEGVRKKVLAAKAADAVKVLAD